MYNSIQHFIEDGIPQFMGKSKDIYAKPVRTMGMCYQDKTDHAGIGLPDPLGCNTMLEDSVKRRISWQIKERAEKHLLTSLGTIQLPIPAFNTKKQRKLPPY